VNKCKKLLLTEQKQNPSILYSNPKNKYLSNKKRLHEQRSLFLFVSLIS
jgi:hypothetical protein